MPQEVSKHFPCASGPGGHFQAPNITFILEIKTKNDFPKGTQRLCFRAQTGVCGHDCALRTGPSRGLRRRTTAISGTAEATPLHPPSCTRKHLSSPDPSSEGPELFSVRANATLVILTGGTSAGCHLIPLLSILFLSTQFICLQGGSFILLTMEPEQRGDGPSEQGPPICPRASVGSRCTAPHATNDGDQSSVLTRATHV